MLHAWVATRRRRARAQALGRHAARAARVEQWRRRRATRRRGAWCSSWRRAAAEASEPEGGAIGDRRRRPRDRAGGRRRRRRWRAALSLPAALSAIASEMDGRSTRHGLFVRRPVRSRQRPPSHVQPPPSACAAQNPQYSHARPTLRRRRGARQPRGLGRGAVGRRLVKLVGRRPGLAVRHAREVHRPRDGEGGALTRGRSRSGTSEKLRRSARIQYRGASFQILSTFALSSRKICRGSARRSAWIVMYSVS